MRFGAIEAGGTKFVCGVGTGPDDLRTAQFPTTTPDETVTAATGWLRGQGGDALDAIGIGSFGPVDLAKGRITSTPKVGWRDFDLAEEVQRQVGAPIAFDTDVNAAVLAEARWGAARGYRDCLYLTVGTGIGGGGICGGRVLHGLTHPEMGHVRIPHDWTQDPYAGDCPFHGDCLEGLASGPALEKRWGVRGADLSPDHPAWALESHYLALGLANFICTLSPQLIVMGGGVMKQRHLFPQIMMELRRLLAGYVDQLPSVVPPGLGDRAGVLGALALADGLARGDRESG